MTLDLNDYRTMTVGEFIEAVENQASRDDTDVAVYKEALEAYGLQYDRYDDPDEMWDDFLKASKQITL